MTCHRLSRCAAAVSEHVSADGTIVVVVAMVMMMGLCLNGSF
jgi:hypothetical protein